MSDILRDITELSRLSVAYRTEVLKPLGLKACHSSYLITICSDPGISQDALAKAICINKSNIARQAAVLEEAGFIQRIPSWEDKRVMKLYPTEKTLLLLPQLYGLLDAWEAQLTQDMSEEEKKSAATLLAKMKARAAESRE